MDETNKLLQIVTIGGGTGHAKVLKSLKGIERLKITGICPTTDSGGSTGELAQQYGTSGYLGDLTKCIAALSPDPVIEKTLLYRFKEGSLQGHSLKNMLLLAIEQVADEDKGLETLWKLCSIGDNRVLPATKEQTELYATLKMGGRVASETNIDRLAKNPLWRPRQHAIKEVFLKPRVAALPQAVSAIKTADWIVISPGDLYSSILPVLLPKGMKTTISKSKARIVMVLNIVNKQGETDDYKAEDFIEKVETYLGRRVDIVFCNNKDITEHIRARYMLENKVVFNTDEGIPSARRVIYAPFAVLNEAKEIVHNVAELRKQFLKLL